MGYEIKQVGCRFELCAENKLAAFDAAIVLFPHGRLASNPNTIEDLLEAMRIEHQVNEREDVIYLGYLGNQGRVPEFFRVIGPFVTAGSQMDFIGEDEKRFSFVFDGTACRLDYFAIPVAMT